MTLDEIGQTYTPIPREAIQEIMLVASEAIAQQRGCLTSTSQPQSLSLE
jgi:hypothetical protein